MKRKLSVFIILCVVGFWTFLLRANFYSHEAAETFARRDVITVLTRYQRYGASRLRADDIKQPKEFIPKEVVLKLADGYPKRFGFGAQGVWKYHWSCCEGKEIWEGEYVIYAYHNANITAYAEYMGEIEMEPDISFGFGRK